MIKVLFLIPTLAHGGAERVLTNLVNHMDSSKFDITVQTMFDVGIYRDKLNPNIKYIGGFPWYFRGNTILYKLFSPQQLYKMYIRGDYDVIVSYLEGPSARVVAGAPNSQKTVCWIHIQFDSLNYALKSFRSVIEMNNVYNSFYDIVCVSESVGSSFSKVVKTEKRLKTIYNTVETEVIREKSLEKINDLSFSNEEINIISVAKLMKSKGYDRLVRILKRLRDSNIPAHVYILGKGEEQVALERMIRENKLEKYWTFLGFKENPYKYVRNADLYVCSSYIEGFSTAVTESLIVGTPVVSTLCSGSEELLGYNDEYGIVTDNNEDALFEGLNRIVTTPGLLQYYKNQAIIRGDKFSTEDTVNAVEAMLEEIADK
ncbi:MAG: glycosyltransferase [Saccharofermentans sp.]|nr:glycosyltransferase [Saccharofermentans sp.]